MSLFALSTRVRDDVVCSLRWAWEIAVPELGISVFEVPREHVKGRRRPRLVVCNRVARAVVEAQRGRHKDFVFVWRRERVTNLDEPQVMAYTPIETVNNTAWQRQAPGDVEARTTGGKAGNESRKSPAAKKNGLDAECI
jgi:hypothetical protein